MAAKNLSPQRVRFFAAAQNDKPVGAQNDMLVGAQNDMQGLSLPVAFSSTLAMLLDEYVGFNAEQPLSLRIPYEWEPF